MKLDRIDGFRGRRQAQKGFCGSLERDGFSWWGTKVGEKKVTWSTGAAVSHPTTSLLCHCLQGVQTVNSPVGMSVATSDWALTQSEQ